MSGKRQTKYTSGHFIRYCYQCRPLLLFICLLALVGLCWKLGTINWNPILRGHSMADMAGRRDGESTVTVTSVSAVDHFARRLGSRDGLKISWVHAVNSRGKMEEALTGDVMMLEADVLLRGQGLPNQTDTPVMAHPPDTDSDITLEQWLGRVINTDKGIKLDFKYISVIEPSMQVIRKYRGNFQQPVWINADIMTGPGSCDEHADTPVDPAQFKRVVLTYFPDCTLSMGWTTRPKTHNTACHYLYTKEMVAEMTSYARDLVQPITFPVRAVYVRASWDALTSLLDESRSYTLTIWSSADDVVDVDDLVYVRENYDIGRIYYDLPENLMNKFLQNLKSTSK